MTPPGRGSETGERTPWLPPRWFVVLAWKVHRALFRVTGGRRGLWRARPQRWGALRLTTTGRRSGQERSVIVGYLEDGPNLVTLAMNGWGEAEPAWWLNLQARPRCEVQLADETRHVVAHAATGGERSRLWDRWRTVDKDLDGWPAAARPKLPLWSSNLFPPPSNRDSSTGIWRFLGQISRFAG